MTSTVHKVRTLASVDVARLQVEESLQTAIAPGTRRERLTRAPAGD